MKKSFIFLFTAVLLAFTACNEDDNKNSGTNVSVSFANPSISLTETATPVQVMFSQAASKAGDVTISFTTAGVAYGTDFTTNPAADSNELVLPFEAGATSVSFTFNKLVNAAQGETKNVTFAIEDISLNNTAITGNTTTVVNFNETASLGNALAALVGGANQPHQVYVDLSSTNMASVDRTAWDLGFYSGSDFRVALNSSLKMSAKQLSTSNIDEVVAADESMLIGQGNGSADQIDKPAGLITQTVIAEVSSNDAQNKVYLINLGNGPAAAAPALGAESSAGGDHRGWKKVRILRSGSDYKIQYANIDATTHQEVIVTKNAAYNFSFFSFTTNGTVQAEPQRNQWDIVFTPFTNIVMGQNGESPYYYPDYIVTNLKGGARSYMVMTSEVTYENFTMANVDSNKFTEDQRNIGSNWRSTSVVGSGGIPVSQFVLKTDRFFVVKDPAGNIYKIKMTGGASETGERGFPTFQYALLQ